MGSGVRVINGRRRRLKAAGAGAAAGAATHALIGAAGLAIGGTAIRLGLLPMLGIGAIAGIAALSIFDELSED